MKFETMRKVKEKLSENRILVAVALLGVVLMLFPVSGNIKESDSDDKYEDIPEFSVNQQEEKLEDILENIEGAGKVKVMLTLKESTEQVLASDSDAKNDTIKNETVIISSGSGTQKTVTVKYIYPVYLGAAVVAEGADRASVKMSITETVSAVTGLEPYQISVIKMKSK